MPALFILSTSRFYHPRISHLFHTLFFPPNSLFSYLVLSISLISPHPFLLIINICSSFLSFRSLVFLPSFLPSFPLSFLPSSLILSRWSDGNAHLLGFVLGFLLLGVGDGGGLVRDGAVGVGRVVDVGVLQVPAAQVSQERLYTSISWPTIGPLNWRMAYSVLRSLLYE